MTIAATIQKQVGSRALYMLGAYNLIDHGDALSFKFKGSRKANHLKITLAGDDTYTMTFIKIRGYDFKSVHEVSGVYVDSLHAVIEDTTGLYTSF